MISRNIIPTFSLSTKILVLIFTGSCIVFAAGWFYFKLHFQQAIENQVGQRAKIIANNLDEFAWINGISPALQRLVTAMGGEVDVAAIAIIKQSPFSIIAASGRYIEPDDKTPENIVGDFSDKKFLLHALRSNERVSAIYRNWHQDDLDYIHIVPTQIKEPGTGNIIPASIYVQLEIREQLEQINKDMMWVTVGFIGGLLLLSALKYSVLMHYVFRPINTIKNTMYLRSQGDVAVYVDNLRNDEIGDVGRALNAMLDIQELSKRELLTQKNLLNTVIESIPLSLFAKSVKDNYRWVIWNKKAEETFGLSQEQVLGKVDYDLFPKTEADFFRATDIKVIEGRQVVDIPEEPVTTQRGTWPAHTIKIPVYDEKGEPNLLVGILEDISERKNREEELKRAKDEAVSANRLKSEFLANISHELRTPMHSIITFSRQGIERIQRWNLSEHEENLKLINSSGARLLLLLNDLLDLSKLEAGAVKYEFKQNDINPIIQTAISSLRSLAREKNLGIEYLNDNVSMATICDSGKMTQVIINLLSNAIKFAPENSRIEVETSPSNELDGSVRISIRDEGLGLPDEELESVFDKFVQSSKTKTGAGGTGLGLAICKEIVSGHGGKIWAENRLSGGACFNILLPTTLKKETTHG